MKVVLFIVTVLLLGVTCVNSGVLMPSEMAGQWAWFAKTSLIFAGVTLIVLLVSRKKKEISNSFHLIVIWGLIALGGKEAAIGLCQLYGFASSNHSLYSLTGSFFNPGPYSGYLAMIFPLCLGEWLKLKEKKERGWAEIAETYLAAGVMLLILCVLPAGMSRSAWLAAIVSGGWVCGMHYNWGKELKRGWKQHRKRTMGIAVVALIGLLVGGALVFHLKKESANGRLFMWKISCQAVSEQPIVGYGDGNFAQAYGLAQEAYFAKGFYSEREELVAGSPEYAFNEYLQVAIEWGIPALLCVLLFIGWCLWKGVAHGRIGVCGGVISLLIFGFSSYPMQLPAFIVAFAFLLAACVIGRRWMSLVVFALAIGIAGVGKWKTNEYEACRKWATCRMLYHSGAYSNAKKEYAVLYPTLKSRGAFLFEYGHCLHKLNEYEDSNKILEEGVERTCDPMLLNVIGKNYQQLGQYAVAEKWLLRSTHRLPGRIYPYYLLAKLYADPNFDQPQQMKRMIDVVLKKEPKVQSAAVKEMREEMRKLSLDIDYDRAVSDRKIKN